METFASEITVDRPTHTVYERISRFEEYPDFMESADEVVRRDPRHLSWRGSLGPIEREFEAEITEERPGELIAWRSVDEKWKEAGEIRLEALDGDRTKVRLSVSYEPESWPEKIADALNLIERRARRDLERLKTHVEGHTPSDEVGRGAGP